MTRAPAALQRFCALLCPLAGATVASGSQAQPLPPLDEYHIRAFGPGDGLLAADVRGLAQTPDGYLYVASGRGLSRYDGYGFHTVELPGFRSSFIDEIYLDGRGRLWILSATDDLAYLEGERIDQLPSPTTSSGGFSESPDGTVWLGGQDGLVRVTPGARTPLTHFTTADGIPSDTAFGVFGMPGGGRIVVTRSGLARVEADPARRGGLRFVPFGGGLTYGGEARADANGLWLQGYDGAGESPFVVRYDGRGFTRYGPGGDAVLDFDDFDWRTERTALLDWSFGSHVPFPEEAEASADSAGRLLGLSLTARDGTRWLTVRERDEGRADLMRGRDGRFEMIPLRSHLEFRGINTLLEDREGSIWVGTDRGLFQLSERRLFALTEKQGLAEGFTAPVIQTSDGSLWVGTWGGGVHRFASGRLTERYTTADGLPDDRIRALYQASDGTLWVGTRRGFAVIRGGIVVLARFGGDEVRAFAETADGRLWIGTTTRLLVRKGTRFASYNEEHWWNRGIWALHTGPDGALWIGSERGLFRLAGDTLQRFGEADGLRSDFVAAIHEEADGTLWFSTYEHGLHRYRNGRFAAVTTREGMHHDGGVWKLLEDGHGGVWMSGDRGIIRVDHARLHAVADAVERGDRPHALLAPLVFTEAEGLPSRESNRASPAGWRLGDGRLVFNNLAGLVVIDPVRATAAPPLPSTVVQGVFTDGQPVPQHAGRIPELPPGTKQLAFDFAALSFLTPLQNRYRYRLDGYDDGWIEGGTVRRASYTGLGPGRYTFRVQGASAGSGWSEGGGTYAFTVSPLFSQTWWFRLPAIAVLTALLAAAYRYRVGRLLELERLRLRIASDLHDDVGSNLSSIALLSEMLQDHDRLDELERRQLQRIHRAADETIGGLRDIIWLVNPKHDNLADLVRRMRGVAGDLLNGTAYEFAVRDPVEARTLDMAFMRNVYLIYKEALHNVVKHAGARRVAIEVAPHHGRFVLRIQDDGGGFAEDQTRGGHGLENMRRRAQQAGGRIEIASAPGQGTRITFTARMA